MSAKCQKRRSALSLPATETSPHRVVRRGASVRTEVPGGCLLGIAVKWLWLGNQRQINLDVFSRCYAAGLLMRTAR